MQGYQEEYLANLKRIASLSMGKGIEARCFETYVDGLQKDARRGERLVARNMELLREHLFPVLDHIFAATEEVLEELKEFAGQLLQGRQETDLGLFCQIHKALLSYARLRRDREAMIRELYWLGIGYNNLCNKLVGLEQSVNEKYSSQMRLYFTEAAAYLKYYDEITDTQTRGYILRSRANMSLGHFSSAGMKIRMVKRTLEILEDKEYQIKEPNLPWDRFIFMTHQQMTASISRGREHGMTSGDIADVMESVYIVYQKQLQEVEAQGKKPPVRTQFSYATIEYYCGFYGLEELLSKMEAMMDEADVQDFSVETMYAVISVPAFYCQYLKDYPELLPKRREYLEGLYQKILKYTDSFPEGSQNEALFFYLRQLALTFVETEGSVSYKEFLQRLQLRFAPEIYVHSLAVGRAAALLCGMIFEEEPAFFDDIDSVSGIEDGQKKREYLLEYALECGIFHDAGKINFLNLYTHTGRQWFEDEYEMAQLHTLAGEACLTSRPSTSRYAAIALGHHCWYDGSRGYPESYKRLECPYRQMVDVIGLVDWLDNVTRADCLYTGEKKSYGEAIEEAISLEGRRFSPLLTARLQEKDVVEKVKHALEQGRQEACRQIYERGI